MSKKYNLYEILFEDVAPRISPAQLKALTPQIKPTAKPAVPATKPATTSSKPKPDLVARYKEMKDEKKLSPEQSFQKKEIPKDLEKAKSSFEKGDFQQAYDAAASAEAEIPPIAKALGKPVQKAGEHIAPDVEMSAEEKEKARLERDKQDEADRLEKIRQQNLAKWSPQQAQQASQALAKQYPQQQKQGFFAGIKKKLGLEEAVRQAVREGLKQGSR